MTSEMLPTLYGESIFMGIDDGALHAFVNSIGSNRVLVKNIRMKFPVTHRDGHPLIPAGTSLRSLSFEMRDRLESLQKVDNDLELLLRRLRLCARSRDREGEKAHGQVGNTDLVSFVVT